MHSNRGGRPAFPGCTTATTKASAAKQITKPLLVLIMLAMLLLILDFNGDGAMNFTGERVDRQTDIPHTPQGGSSPWSPG